MTPLWRNRSLTLVLSGQLVSQFGDWVAFVAVPLFVLSKTGSPLLTAAAMAVEMAPGLLLGALAGAVVDRSDRRRVMIAADLVRGLLLLAMARTESTGVLLALVFAVGSASQFFLPALGASLPNIVPAGQLLAANSLRQGLINLAMVAGPPFGGAVVALLGAHQAFVVDAASFFASALCLALARIPSPAAGRPREPLRDELTAGLAFLRRNGAVSGGLLLTLAVVLAGSALNALEPLLVTRWLGGGSLTYGLLIATWGAGMLAGSLAAGALSRRLGLREAFLLALALQWLSPTLIALLPALYPILLSSLIGGSGNALENILLATLVQRLVPDALRGRVFTVQLVSLQTVGMLATLTWGALAQAVPLRALLAAAALILAVAYPLGRRYWPLRDEMLA